MMRTYMTTPRILLRFGGAVFCILFLAGARAPGIPSHAVSLVPDTSARREDEKDPADSLYRAARQALNDNDYRKAERLFASITSRFPRSTYAGDALYWRAFALYKLGAESDLREAVKSLDTQRSHYGNARTANEAQQLAVRIRGALAKRGDVSSAEAVTALASGTTKCSRTGDAEEKDDFRAEVMNTLLQMDAQSAVPIIKEVLAQRDACSTALRKKAVFLLSQKQTSETEGLMMDAVKNDPSSTVREEAVFWLGQVRTDKAASLLENIALTATDTRLREKAIFALNEQNSSRSFTVIRKLAESAETPSRVREQAIFWLGQRQSAENAEFLRGLFGRMSGNDDLRKQVLFSLSQMHGVGNDRWLLGVALDRNQSDDVRKHALWTAGQAGIPASDLVALYDKLTDRPLKEQLIWVLSDSRDRAASDKLVDIAQHDKDAEMRKKAIFWLGQKNDPRIRQILIDILKG